MFLLLCLFVVLDVVVFVGVALVHVVVVVVVDVFIVIVVGGGVVVGLLFLLFRLL